MAVIDDAIDKLGLRFAKAVAVPGDFFRLDPAFFQQGPRRGQIDIRAIHLARNLVIPRVRFLFADLPPAAHLREIPDRVAVVGVGGKVTIEDVEIRQGSFIAFFILKGAGHAVGNHGIVRADVFRARQDLHGLGPVGVVVLVQPAPRADQGLDNGPVGVGVFFGPGRAHAKHLLRIVFPDFIVGDQRHADALEYGLLIPGFAHAVAVNGAGLQRGRHLRRRGDREQHIGVDLAGDIRAGVIARMNAARRQPVTQFVVVRRDREYHAHIERLACGPVLIDHGFQVIGLDRMRGFAVCAQRHMRLHLPPDIVGDSDGIAV